LYYPFGDVKEGFFVGMYKKKGLGLGSIAVQSGSVRSNYQTKTHAQSLNHAHLNDS